MWPHSTGELTATHLVSFTEPKPKIHQVLHPDEAVSILVTHVEHLFKPPQKLEELLVVGRSASFHCGAGFVGGSFKQPVGHSERRSPSSFFFSSPHAPTGARCRRDVSYRCQRSNGNARWSTIRKRSVASQANWQLAIQVCRKRPSATADSLLGDCQVNDHWTL